MRTEIVGVHAVSIPPPVQKVFLSRDHGAPDTYCPSPITVLRRDLLPVSVSSHLQLSIASPLEFDAV
jgi:hypothetical protein